MKTLKLFSLMIAMIFATTSQSKAQSTQTAGKQIKTIKVTSSTVCEMCKERIERELVFEKGVKDVKVDLKANTITVKYRNDKTDPDKIKLAISKLGYSADDVAGDPEAFKKLPECCQKEGCGKKTD